jgi:hypothetical protein
MTRPEHRPEQPLLEVELGKDGDRYQTGYAENLVWLRLYDCTGDDALVHMAPADMARLRDDLSRTLLAAGRTPGQINADVIANSLRIVLERIDEYKKASSAEVARLYGMVLAHVKASCPEALRALTEVAP